MVDEQEPAKRVVKKVVKKTVVRPAQKTRPQPGEPQVRYGRPVPTASRPRATAESRNATAPTPRSVPAPRPAPRQQKPRRQPVDVRARLGSAGHRVGDAWWAVADGAGAGARTSGRFVAARARAVAAWRLPHINLYLAAVITGALTGLVSVGLGVGALRVFEHVRGVSAGGGFWGGLAFLAVALVAVLLGQLLLSGFGSHAPRLTSFLAVLLTVIAILGLFLGQTDSAAGLFIVPALGIAAHVVAHWLLDLAENTPALVE